MSSCFQAPMSVFTMRQTNPLYKFLKYIICLVGADAHYNCSHLVRAYWVPDTKLSVFKTRSHSALTSLQTGVLTVALPLAPFHRCRNRGRQTLITSLKVTQLVNGRLRSYCQASKIGPQGNGTTFCFDKI